MATVLPNRPATNGGTPRSGGNLNRQASLSSFPSSRTPSTASRTGPPKIFHNRTRHGGSNSSSHEPSTPTSSSYPTDGPIPPHRIRKIKPQYPADSPEQFSSCIRTRPTTKRQQKPQNWPQQRRETMGNPYLVQE